MTPEDRELLQALRRQQTDLQRSLARLDHQLEVIESRDQNPADLPPVPAELSASPVDQPTALPPVPRDETPILPPLPPVPRPSLEFQFGRWLTRIGAVFGIITLVLILSLTHTYLFARLGPVGILGLSGAFCTAIVILAQRLERRDPRLMLFARSLLALGLAGLYVTLYAAHGFDAVRIIRSPLTAGFLLLLWSLYVFFLAERKGSQALALFAIALAYFSTAINPVGGFSMAADLLLAGTGVVFLLRRGWAVLSFLSLLGTYFALFRRLVIDRSGEMSFDTMLPFAPYAVYLIGAWIIFTAAVLTSTQPSFRGGRRIAFLSLNNGALAGLLSLTTYLAGYGYRAMGSTLVWMGVAFLVTAVLSGGRRPDAAFAQVSAAYLGQGLAVFTAGLIGVYAGVTRGVLLALETFVLGLGASFSSGGILRIAAYLTALFATLFLAWEIGINSHHPWVLGVGGAVVMLLNAWWARQNRRPSPSGQRELVLASSYYCALALVLIVTAMATKLSDSALPPALAFVAVVLTFSVYLFPLYELPPVAQTLLLGAQALVLFPAETGEELPRSSTAWVAVLTLVLLAWWSRQRITRYGPWIVTLNFVYALALVGLAYHAVRPYTDHQGWMIGASLLSGAFLIFGAFTRVWPLAAMGQLFLAVAVYHFYFPEDRWYAFPWTWWAAGIPIAMVLATGRGVHAWLREFPEVPETVRLPLTLLAFGYQLLALAMLARLIFGVVPLSAQTGVFLFLGTFILAWNAARAHPFGVRCSFVLSAIGIFLLVNRFQTNPHALLTFLNGLALFSLLSQPTLLRHASRPLVTRAESWLLILFSSAAGWLFVSEWVALRWHPNYLTMGWAFYALFLFFWGLLGWERRQRWCGLGILAAAMVRVVFSDIWGFSNGYKVFTLIVLTAITLGLGYMYARFADRLKTWL
jgi:hypothetical protein